MLAAWQGIGGFTEERASLRTWRCGVLSLCAHLPGGVVPGVQRLRVVRTFYAQPGGDRLDDRGVT